MHVEIGTETSLFSEKKYINGIFVAVSLADLTSHLHMQRHPTDTYIPTVTLHSYSRFPKVHLHSFNRTLRSTDGLTPRMTQPPIIHIPFQTGAPPHPHRRTFTYG